MIPNINIEDVEDGSSVLLLTAGTYCESDIMITLHTKVNAPYVGVDEKVF